MPEKPPFRFADICAGIGGFHAALAHAGGECTFVSELDARARAVYERSWIKPLPEGAPRPEVDADITKSAPTDGNVTITADFEVLTAGFPCQTFSKSGSQAGMEEARGTIFYNIAQVIKAKKPRIVMLENVRNLAGPRHAHEWDVIIKTLRELGYRVSSTPTVFSPHLLPPHLGGTPQVRDRVYILGTLVEDEVAQMEDPGPVVARAAVSGWAPQRWSAEWVLEENPRGDYRPSIDDEEAIRAWAQFVSEYRQRRVRKLPGHPLWADFWVPRARLKALGYAAMPKWKQAFVDKNVDFYLENADWIDAWRKRVGLADFVASRRKLEWQAGDIESLHDTAMQLRPSGIRAKAPTYLPALVAITQTSVIGSKGRHLTPRETARLQGFPDTLDFGNQPDSASYRQTGNAVAVGAVWHVFRSHVERDQQWLPGKLVRAVLDANPNPVPNLLAAEAYEASASLAEDQLPLT